MEISLQVAIYYLVFREYWFFGKRKRYIMICIASAMVALPSLKESDVSPYISFSRKEWSALRNSTPMTVSEDDLREIRGINENISTSEVEDVFLPLSRLLQLYYQAQVNLYIARRTFLEEPTRRVPYVIGIAGSVAVGKSTIGRLLKVLISRWPSKPKVDLITTDGFLFPNAVLEKKNLMERKGFPESYDIKSLITFLYELKSGRPGLKIPIYSHLTYDIVPNEFSEIDAPDIVILEGLNVLQTRTTLRTKNVPELIVSDFFDFSIYIDAEESAIKKWFLDRFMILRKTAFTDPRSYFRKLADIPENEALKIGGEIWDRINGVNLVENIAPTKYHAHLILVKGADHCITQVHMRKI